MLLQLNARLTQPPFNPSPSPGQDIKPSAGSPQRSQRLLAKHLPCLQTGSTEQYQSSTNNLALPILDLRAFWRAEQFPGKRSETFLFIIVSLWRNSIVAASDRHMRARSPVNSLCLISLPCFGLAHNPLI
jgi:hypothetical protein